MFIVPPFTFLSRSSAQVLIHLVWEIHLRRYFSLLFGFCFPSEKGELANLRPAAGKVTRNAAPFAERSSERKFSDAIPDQRQAQRGRVPALAVLERLQLLQGRLPEEDRAL